MPEILNESLIRKYLLGTASPENRELIENTYFGDSVALEAIVAAENDLIDSYARGGLTNEERRYFEERYKASADMSARVGFAKVFAQIVESEKKMAPTSTASVWYSISSFLQPRRPQIAWAVTGVAVLLAISLLSVQNYSLHKDLRDARVDATRIHQENNALRGQIAALNQNPQLQKDQKSSQVASLETPTELGFTLVTGSPRGTAVGRDLVPPNGGWVRLEMVLDRDEFRSYEAVLQTAEGNDVLRAKHLQSTSIRGDRVVVWRVSSNSVLPGDYVLRLSGESEGKRIETESYSFRVSSK